jgi:3',5'-cyclic AMP phosphodiesterase CpdA
MPTRRHFITNLGIAGAGTLLAPRTWAIPPAPAGRSLRFGLISDLHHLQFGNREEARLTAFMDTVLAHNPDFILQNGDFCRPEGSNGIMAQWNRFSGPKYHVLGNHDMDVCDKAAIMRLWGMERTYYSLDTGGYHFVVMDRNFLKTSNGTLADYAHSNWGPLPAPQRSFTDSAQLDWLRHDLASATRPVIVFMHQPVWLSDFVNEIGNASDILAIFDEANLSTRRIAAVFMGHDHDDRYGERNGVHYFLLNSATYAYCSKGAFFYKDPLFAWVTLEPSGRLILQGRSSVYRDGAPDDVRSVFPAKISDHAVQVL